MFSGMGNAQMLLIGLYWILIWGLRFRYFAVGWEGAFDGFEYLAGDGDNGE